MAAFSGGSTSFGGAFNLLPDDVTDFPHLGNVNNKRRRNADGSATKQVQICGGEPLGPRFVVIKSADPNHQLPVNPFKIGAEIDKIASGKVLEVTKMRSGDLLVKAKSSAQAKKMLKCTNLPFSNTKVVIEEHAVLNRCKGKIYRYDFRFLTDEEILEGLKEQRVVEIYRQKRRRDNSNELEDSGIYVLTFDSLVLPAHITAGYSRTKVSAYIPNPMRCNLCLKYGHTQKSCRNEKLCARCGDKFHEKCEKPLRCINCVRSNSNRELGHSAISRECPVFQMEFEVQKIKSTNGVTRREALKIMATKPSPLQKSFAAAVKSKSCGCACTCSKTLSQNSTSQRNATPAPAAIQTSNITANSPSTPILNANLQPIVLVPRLPSINFTSNTTHKSQPPFSWSGNGIGLPPNGDTANKDGLTEPIEIDSDGSYSKESPFKGFSFMEENQQQTITASTPPDPNTGDSPDQTMGAALGENEDL